MHIKLPGSDSLKAKRRRIKPLLARLQREFNISTAEVDYQDRWADAVIGCTMISTENGHAERSMQKVADWLDKHWPDVTLLDEQIEIIR